MRPIFLRSSTYLVEQSQQWFLWSKRTLRGSKRPKTVKKTRFPLFSLIFYMGNARNLGFALTSIVPIFFFFSFLVFWHPKTCPLLTRIVRKCHPQNFEWNKSVFLDHLGRPVDGTVSFWKYLILKPTLKSTFWLMSLLHFQHY